MTQILPTTTLPGASAGASMPSIRDAQSIENFFREIAYKLAGYAPATFSYIAVKSGEEFLLLQGRLSLDTAAPQSPFTYFQSENIRAGSYTLSELQPSAAEFVSKLMSGYLPTPHGELRFPPNEGGSFLATYDPHHPAGQSQQSRFDILTILGGAAQQHVQRPDLAWELRASSTPYDSLQELAFEYSLGSLRDVMNVEVVAFNVAAIDGESTVTSQTAKLAVRLASELSPERLTLGHRVFVNGRVVRRAIIAGNEMSWEKQEQFQHGRADIEVPPAAVLQCFVSYKGRAQNHYWVADPTTAANARRVVYELADNQLEILTDFLTKSQSRGRDARELETGVAWLLWMLGFSVAHLGSTPRTQDAIDLIATTPSGHLAVIECTTGLLKADHKLPRVVERAEAIRRRLTGSGNRHLHVLAIMVTSKTRAEVAADIEQAERLRVLVLTREDLEQSIPRTLAPANADQIFKQGEQAVQAAAEKYEAQLPLSAPSI